VNHAIVIELIESLLDILKRRMLTIALGALVKGIKIEI